MVQTYKSPVNSFGITENFSGRLKQDQKKNKLYRNTTFFGLKKFIRNHGKTIKVEGFFRRGGLQL